jgi:hypothetical protein
MNASSNARTCRRQCAFDRTVCCAVAERQPRPAFHPATIGQVAKNRVIVTDVCMSRVYRTRAGAKDAGSPSLKSLTLKARQP